MSDTRLPKYPAICSQCGQRFSERACGPTHAMIWHSIEEPVQEELRALALAAAQEGTYGE